MSCHDGHFMFCFFKGLVQWGKSYLWGVNPCLTSLNGLVIQNLRSCLGHQNPKMWAMINIGAVKSYYFRREKRSEQFFHSAFRPTPLMRSHHPSSFLIKLEADPCFIHLCYLSGSNSLGDSKGSLDNPVCLWRRGEQQEKIFKYANNSLMHLIRLCQSILWLPLVCSYGPPFPEGFYFVLPVALPLRVINRACALLVSSVPLTSHPVEICVCVSGFGRRILKVPRECCSAS